MRHKAICTIAAAFLCAFQAAPAQAQTRVFVAAQGSDSSPCTFAQPCRTFQRAHNVVAANGEIDVLDPAGYGAVTITKAISIQGHGFAGLAVGSGVGITVNAGTTDVVNLNGLLIDGSGIGFSGIVFNTGKSLIVENCVIRKLFIDGIGFFPNASSSLAVSNTLVAENGGKGINILPTGASASTVQAVFNRVEAYNNANDGIFVSGDNAPNGGTIEAVAVETLATNNNGSGFVATSLSGPPTVL